MPIDLSRFDNSGFDRGASRVKEALWFACKAVFFLPAFPWPSSLRAALLRLFGAKVGAGAVIRSRVNITFPWRLRLGDHAWIGEEVLILSLAEVAVGDSVCLSQRAFLCTGSHDHRRDDFALITKPIRIGDGAWVGANAFVGPGADIGSGSVVAACACAVKPVPPDSLAAGNPAQIRPLS